MPDGRLERTREAYKPLIIGSYEWAMECERVRLQSGFTANVIEGDHFDTDRDPGDENPPTRRLRRRAA